MRVGAAEIVALTDMSLSYSTPFDVIWPGISPEEWAPFRERFPGMFDGERLRIEIGCYLVRSEGKTILVDTGYGPGPLKHIGGRRGLLMSELEELGVVVEEIDVVAISHLHVDHVGWNTREYNGTLFPRFPRARYVAHQADLEHFRTPAIQEEAPFPYMRMYVEPLVDAGVLESVTGEVALTSEVRLLETPGHTPGHMSLMVASGSERALVQGDAFVHPAQFTNEHWNSKYDADHETATATRVRLLDLIEAEAARVASCHFPKPGFGRVIRFEGRRYWSADT